MHLLICETYGLRFKTPSAHSLQHRKHTRSSHLFDFPNLSTLLRFTPWWIWVLPALAWGVGLAIHALVALTSDEDDWLEHEQGMQWWREQRRRRHDERMARIRATEPRARIEEHGKELRVASDTRDAEEEAAAAEAEGPSRRRRR